MCPVRDLSLDLSPQASDLPLIATNRMSANTLSIEGTPMAGLAVRVNLAAVHGSTKAMALNVIVHAASSTPVASSDDIVGQMPAPYSLSQNTLATTELIIPFQTTKRYVRCEFALTGAATDSPSWSVVEAYVTENVQAVWDRNTNFH